MKGRVDNMYEMMNRNLQMRGQMMGRVYDI